MYQNKSVDVHKFTMIPDADIPRSRFVIEKTHKTTFDAGALIPIYVDEILPGDTFNLRMTAFGRLATPIVPVMDNLYLDTFFFFVPNRLVWDNWQRFMGEQDNPDDSISFLVPQVTGQDAGWPVGGLGDHFGLPTVGQVVGDGQPNYFNALYFRAYNLIWNEWFRDENLQDSVSVPKDDGPDIYSLYGLLRRGKRKDYFTGALPWPVKGGVSVPLPLGDRAPIIGLGKRTQNFGVGGTPRYESTGASRVYGFEADISPSVADQSLFMEGTAASGGYPAIFADLSEATAATINQLRQAFQIQRLLERDARGGTRYTELIRAHFGVTSPDARLQRPEYLGGGTQRITINPVPQTSGTDSGGTETPQGNLAATGTVLAHGHGFNQSFTEHGMIIGLAMVRADLTYQQGVRRLWTRRTRYDYYFPAFAMLGEQAVLQKEIYYQGTAADETVFGYQERWAEYRYNPSEITGLFRSTSLGTIDVWHLAQRFTSAPTLNSTFIEENPPLDRIIAVGTAAGGQQIILDMFFRAIAARPLPMFSVPGLIDHF